MPVRILLLRLIRMVFEERFLMSTPSFIGIFHGCYSCDQSLGFKIDKNIIVNVRSDLAKYIARMQI
jgi:hypothetical protein